MANPSATTAVTDRPSGVDPRPAPTQAGSAERGAYERIREFLDRTAAQTPCLVMDLPTVRDRYAQLRSAFADARICYAVKANPAPEVVAALVALGSSFDVASLGEIELCLAHGATADSISYGNTIKKRSDVAKAHALGVRLFVTDNETDLRNIAAVAPGSRVFCRVLVDDKGSRTPFGRKFGCPPQTAAHLLRSARDLGLDAYGVSFHMGSQQLDPTAWEQGIAAARNVFDAVKEHGVRLRMVNLGGGLPASYLDPVPPLERYAALIEQSIEERFGADRPELLIEPGRFLVGDAGVLRSEVVLVVPEHGSSGRRWVYLDVGRYGGLAEAEGEAIAYRVRTSRDGDPVGRVVLAGPTCDGDDVLYQRTAYELPETLSGGDHVDFLSAGAYTASYSSVCFNGFGPLPTWCLDHDQRVGQH